jgi:hypothetical protein
VVTFGNVKVGGAEFGGETGVDGGGVAGSRESVLVEEAMEGVGEKKNCDNKMLKDRDKC